MSIWKSRIENNGFISKSGDVIEIVNDTSKHYATVSGHIVVRLRNDKYNEVLPETSLPNKPATWKFLKDVGGVGGRKVEYVTYLDGVEVERIPYTESYPYKYRFG